MTVTDGSVSISRPRILICDQMDAVSRMGGRGHVQCFLLCVWWLCCWVREVLGCAWCIWVCSYWRQLKWWRIRGNDRAEWVALYFCRAETLRRFESLLKPLRMSVVCCLKLRLLSRLNNLFGWISKSSSPFSPNIIIIYIPQWCSFLYNLPINCF